MPGDPTVSEVAATAQSPGDEPAQQKSHKARPAPPRLNGRRVELAAPVPWPDPVELEDVLDEMAGVFARHIFLPRESIDAIALWILLAHAQDATEIMPLLVLSSPQKRCGKTTTMYVIQSLVPKPLPCSSITDASVFRVIEECQPTLLIDEADTFIHDRRELTGILNSGHMRSMARVIRTEGEGAHREVRMFSTWAPKVIALIRTLPATLEDRSIKVVLQRKPPSAMVEPLRLDRLAEMGPIQRKAARWVTDNLVVLRESIHGIQVPAELPSDRARDNWRPLLAIAEMAGRRWAGAAWRAAMLLSGTEEPAPELSTELLQDIREIFTGWEQDEVRTSQLVLMLVDLEGRPWAECNNGRALTQNKLAWYLRPFNVRPRKVRLGTQTANCYVRDDFAQAFASYLPPQPEQPELPAEIAPSGIAQEPEHLATVPDAQSPGKPRPAWSVPRVPLHNARVGTDPATALGLGVSK